MRQAAPEPEYRIVECPHCHEELSVDRSAARSTVPENPAVSHEAPTTAQANSGGRVAADRTITIPVANVEEWCRRVLADPEAIALRAEARSAVPDRETTYPHRGSWRHAPWCDPAPAGEGNCVCGLNKALAALAHPAPDTAGGLEALADARATIEAMSGDAADLHDLMDEAAVLRTALAHVLVRTHDGGCGTCDAARALLTAGHELPSRAALAAIEAEARSTVPDRERDVVRFAHGDEPYAGSEYERLDSTVPDRGLREAAERVVAIWHKPDPMTGFQGSPTAGVEPGLTRLRTNGSHQSTLDVGAILRSLFAMRGFDRLNGLWVQWHGDGTNRAQRKDDVIVSVQYDRYLNAIAVEGRGRTVKEATAELAARLATSPSIEPDTGDTGAFDEREVLGWTEDEKRPDTGDKPENEERGRE